MDESIKKEYYEACRKYYFFRKTEDCEGFVYNWKEYYQGKKEMVEKIFVNKKEETETLRQISEKALEKALEDYRFYFDFN